MDKEKEKKIVLWIIYGLIIVISIILIVTNKAKIYGIIGIAYIIADLSTLWITTKKRKKMLEKMGIEDNKQPYKEIKKLYKEWKKNEKSRKNIENNCN